MQVQVERPVFRYAVLLLLLAVTLLYQARYTGDIVRGEKVDTPLVVTNSASNEVAFADPLATGAGVRVGDRVLAVNGLPFTGTALLGRALAHTPAGGAVAIQIHPSGAPASQTRTISLSVQAIDSTYLQRSGDLVLHFLLPAVCVVLGFTVAFLRPRDPLAWLLLAVMLSFPHILETYRVQGWPRGWAEGAMVYHAGLGALFPIAMFTFGRFFPEPFPAGIYRRAWQIQQWIFALPFAIVALGGTVIQVGELSDYARMAPLQHLLRPADKIAQILVYWLIGSFFAAMAFKGGMSKSADARRRVLTVYWGATLAFTPEFFFTTYSLVRHRSQAELLPQWAIVLALVPLLIFPLTLAYVIAVHKAMDVSVVVRQSLQYALATNGLRAVQFTAMAALAVIAVGVLGESHRSHVQSLAFLLLAAGAVLSLRRLAGRLRIWIDRRFFREAYDAEYVLTELSDQVRSIVETTPLLQTVAGRIAETLHVAEVLVLLRGGGSLYQPVYALGYGGTPDCSFFPDTGTAEVLRQRKEPARVYLSDRGSWLYREAGVDDEERAKLARLHTELLLPLLVREKLLGFISLGPKRSEEPYTGSDLRLLRSVATQTGLALENANLMREIAAEVSQRERLNREVEIAREVQERLFPQELPTIQGLDYAGYCRPALGVGGDYYDFLALRDGQLGVALGDVSGKGIAAALMMASLQASLRGEVARAPEDLATMVGNVNRLVFDVSSANRYATFFYGQYDPASRLFRYVNAGHNPPLIFPCNGGAPVTRLEDGGTVVGLLPDASYKQGAVCLSPGDVLVAFTDGISEAMNLDDEEWGDERLIAAVGECSGLRAEAMLKRILLAADSFVAGARQHDDMTLIVMQVRD